MFLLANRIFSFYFIDLWSEGLKKPKKKNNLVSANNEIDFPSDSLFCGVKDQKEDEFASSDTECVLINDALQCLK